MAFPLIENLRAIGNWSPSAETPFPANVSAWLKRFCETIYWREDVWKIENKRNIWTANIFKSPYLKWLKERNLQGIARYFFEAVLVSLIVQAWILPLTVIYFHRVPVFGILLNLWVGIIIAMESFAAIFAVFVGQISDILALPFIKLTEIFNWLLLSIPNFLTDSGWASIRLPVYSGAMRVVYLLYFLPLIVLTILLNCWKPFDLNSRFKIQDSRFRFSAAPLLRAAVSCFLLLFVLIVFHPFSTPKADGRLHIDFLDVGQGDAALITFPNGETLLVDGGGKAISIKLIRYKRIENEPENFEPDTQSIGEAVVSEFFWQKGYSQIDYILATHADADHIQGFLTRRETFRVRAAIFGRTPLKNSDLPNLFDFAKARNRIGNLSRAATF
jgi:competence protein ComEC